jgi:hypothetical protein
MPLFFRSTARALLLAAGAMAGAGAQEPLRKYPPPQQRFEGVVQVGAAARRKPVQVDLRTWILGPGLRNEQLPLPPDATVIVELHGGELETLVGNQRAARQPGAIWRVRPGERITFSTGDDSATLTTLVLRSR